MSYEICSECNGSRVSRGNYLDLDEDGQGYEMQPITCFHCDGTGIEPDDEQHKMTTHITKRLRQIPNAWHFPFHRWVCVYGGMVRFRGGVAHYLTRRYMLSRKVGGSRVESVF